MKQYAFNYLITLLETTLVVRFYCSKSFCDLDSDLFNRNSFFLLEHI